ncbi:hypothetical protein CAEBREN_00531 [Caenorhabditis brenneri]|uniref:BTB domain-containing protein n=1 Tax=Caenorhabditis brenneri TaxID=135651 RepID=G0MUV5_CAEBE|nr:hypothetical protein CAEBREN_00531 [Caenorhabditis brenneri]
MAGLYQSSMLMFDKEDERINDVCLMVKDRKFWCSKKTLSFHSESFYSMFSGNFAAANAKEIILNDPEHANDFHLFLLIIHGYRPLEEYDDATITRVMALSNQWIARLPYQLCLEHLLKSGRSQLDEKYAMAQKYKLEEYEKSIKEAIDKRNELRRLETIEHYRRNPRIAYALAQVRRYKERHDRARAQVARKLKIQGLPAHKAPLVLHGYEDGYFLRSRRNDPEFDQGD